MFNNRGSSKSPSYNQSSRGNRENSLLSHHERERNPLLCSKEVRERSPLSTINRESHSTDKSPLIYSYRERSSRERHSRERNPILRSYQEKHSKERS